MKHPKMDPLLVSKAKHEIDYIVARFKKKEGLRVTKNMIIQAVATVGRSRRKVYAYLRNRVTKK